tara:strand:+ start:10244 stop:11716 length:1473 start_codon:yes stop_codon:yes gene_type:complete
MKEKKHIDRLFQERFKDFEVAPKNAVWENIASQLNKKKKKRRIIPVWWRYAGVAALLALLFTVGDIYFNNNTMVPANQVVDTKDSFPSKSSNTNDYNKVNKTSNPIIADTKENNVLENLNNNEKKQDPVNTSTSSIIANSTSEISKLNSTNSTTEIMTSPNVSQESLIDRPNEIADNSEEKNKQNLPIDDSTNNIKNAIEKNTNIKNNAPVVANTKNEGIDSTTNIAPIKKSLSIEDALAKTKTDEEEDNISNKWSITPNAAPVYFNSLGRGSSIDSQFNDNSKSGEVNMSYGVIASYALSKNLKIRSGINKLNLGYNTKDVFVYESVRLRSSTSGSIKNINSNDNIPQNISFVSGESLGNLKNESFIKTSNTSINQSLGFIEIPLEIEYAIINKKFGVNLIGGFSSLFLNNNKLYSDVNGERTLIGEATNLNNVSYSANFGLGLNYKMTQKFELNLEPVFKYQINTFNNTSGDFKPFFIGVYTGIGFKF